MPLKPFCHRESICEHGIHGPHFVIGGQYRPVVCLHFPSTTYSPATYGTMTRPTLQSPNQRGSSMSSVVALELSKPLFLQRWVGDRPSRVKSPVYQAYSQAVRQILQTTKCCPQSEDPIKVAHHLLSPTHCVKHQIATLASPIAVLNKINEGLIHTLVARQPWCKIHGSHPSVQWFVPSGSNTPPATTKLDELTPHVIANRAIKHPSPHGQMLSINLN